jgi:hypothetical protein
LTNLSANNEQLAKNRFRALITAVNNPLLCPPVSKALSKV